MREWKTRGIALFAVLAVAGIAIAAAVARPSGAQRAAAPSGCLLAAPGSAVKHVVYLQFDNTHLNRDRPNVASDLEQMPHLLSFLKDNGTLFTNDHTILISHTGGGIVSSLTGLYPDRNGIGVSNSYRYFKSDGTTLSSSAFKYWTDLVDDTGSPPADPLTNMITDGQKNTPAPWVPFTRAGCNVGGVGTANIELENTSTGPNGDIAKVFGCPSSPECVEASNPNGSALKQQAQTDFVGIAIHCGANTTCATAPNAKDDKLPDEPGGYQGFKGLFGAKYVDPFITGGNACVKNTADENIADPKGTCGFPGFDGMFAKNTLGYVAQMQENGVPVTYGYISDAHDTHTPNTTTDAFDSAAQGPGESGYVAQLKAYDEAFDAFFKNLAAHGIDKSNTLFVVTVDEGDHFAGGIGAPQSDGTLGYSHTFCNVTAGQTCPSNQIGEVNLNLTSVLPAGEPPFLVHSDSSPTVYVTGNPSRTDPALRKLERDVAGANAVDPYAGTKPIAITSALVDRIGEKALHMLNSDPQRDPTFTLFGNPDFFISTFNTNCPDSAHSVASCISPGFAWNHGDIQQEIGNTWVGFVGPGVAANGVDPDTWTDHTNVRPTILALAGLKDDYLHDGFVLTQALDKKALPNTLFQHQKQTEELGQAYEQLNAPFGQFSADVLKASTKALASGSSDDDSVYATIEDKIESLTSDRDRLSATIKQALDGMAFDGRGVPAALERSWVDQTNAILALADVLASAPTKEPPVPQAKALDKIDHIVVIYEENHSFDNLFGGWEGVNGLNDVHVTGVGDHVTQVDQNGVAYGCLRQLDANLTSPPLPSTCTDATHGITSNFLNRYFSIDDFIHPSAVTCPPITNAFAFPNGLRDPGINPANDQPVAGARPGGCTRDLVHEFYQEQYQLDGGKQDRYMSGSDSAGTTMGVYDTTQTPLYQYLHEKGHPDYAIADNFFQAAFGGSFLNHQWLIAAATPTYGGAPASLHSIIDSNGMPTAYPLYAPTGPVSRQPLTVACPAPAAARICGDYAVNTMQPTSNPQGGFGAILPPQTATTIGDELTGAGVDWAWYSGGWSNADGDVGAPGYTNGTSASATPTGCSDPNVDPGVRNGVPVSHWPRCPDALFQYHHQPFNYFANYAPGTPGRAHLQDEVAFQDLVGQSGSDCKLKAVSFVKPIGEENEHPGYASEPNGNSHLTSTVRAIEGSACAKDTMIIVTYDEFGGQWDHVSPPGQGNDNGPHDVWGPGTRIPAVVIAPHLHGDFVVDSTEHDTTSILATIEHRFDLPPLGTRDAAVADLSTVFDAHKPKT